MALCVCPWVHHWWAVMQAVNQSTQRAMGTKSTRPRHLPDDFRLGEGPHPGGEDHIVAGPLDRARAEADERLGPRWHGPRTCLGGPSCCGQTIFCSCPARGKDWKSDVERSRRPWRNSSCPSAKSVEVLPNRWVAEPGAPPTDLRGPPSLDHEGSTHTMVLERLQQATKTWGKWRHLLATTGQPVETRVPGDAPPPWTSSKWLADKIVAAESKWTRWNVGLRKQR